MQNLGEGLSSPEFNNRVHMVGHDHNTYPPKSTFGFQPIKCFKDNWCAIVICEELLSLVRSDDDMVVGTRYGGSAFT